MGLNMHTIPQLNRIDHVHVYVKDRSVAEKWFREILGFRIQKEFEFWAVDGGPLTLENNTGSVHLALFESDKPPSSTVAFGVSGEEFLSWKIHLESLSIELSISDHTKAWSMYFSDPFQNLFEITTYDFDAVKNNLE